MAARKITYDRYGIPSRIKVPDTTIPFTAHSFDGSPYDYTFKSSRMVACRDAICAALKRLGITQFRMRDTANGGFVMVAGDPNDPIFVWYKYAGKTSTAGDMNRIYNRERVLYTSSFLTASHEDQEAMIVPDPFRRMVMKFDTK